MARPTLLILPATETAQAILAVPKGDSYETQRVSKEQLNQIDDTNIHIVVPGQSVRIFETDLPKASRTQLLKMARFAREDDIATPADGLHFALSEEQPPRLAIIEKSIMGELSTYFAVLKPKAVYTDYDLITGDQAVHIIDRAVEPGQCTLDLDWIDSELLDLTPAQIADQFADTIEAGEAINLLQGDYRAKSTLNIPQPAFKRFATMAALALVALFVWSGISDRAKTAQAEALKTQTAEDYKSVTGQTAPRAPGRDAVKLAQTTSQGSYGFLDLSAVLFEGMTNLDDIQVDQLRYNSENQTLALRFIYPDFGATSRLEAAIQQAGGTLLTGGVRERDGAFIGEATLSLESAS